MAKDFPLGEESLKRLREQSAGIIQNTSPLGAEKILGELEEMRTVFEKLRGLWEEEEERLRGLLESRGACERQVGLLEAELGEFTKGLQRLAQEGLEPAGKEAGTEDALVARWRLYSVSGAWPRPGAGLVWEPGGQHPELLPYAHALCLPGSWHLPRGSEEKSGISPTPVFQMRKLKPGEIVSPHHSQGHVVS